MALYLREIQPRLLNTFTPPTPLRFPPQIGVVTSQIAFSKFFNVLPQPLVMVVWQLKGWGQTGVKVGLSSLCYWQTETSCFSVKLSLKENTSDMKLLVLTGPDLSCILRQWPVMAFE